MDSDIKVIPVMNGKPVYVPAVNFLPNLEYKRIQAVARYPLHEMLIALNEPDNMGCQRHVKYSSCYTIFTLYWRIQRQAGDGRTEKVKAGKTFFFREEREGTRRTFCLSAEKKVPVPANSDSIKKVSLSGQTS
ncbi:hypothetical protein JWG39_08470 [Desulforhopalus vacuolatus]|nr:hypothetical protein [Desulforhopalus vacuolatus]